MRRMIKIIGIPICAALIVVAPLAYPAPVGALTFSFNAQAPETNVGNWVVNEPVENLSVDIDNNGLRDLVRFFKNNSGKKMADILLSNGTSLYRLPNATPQDIGDWYTYGERVHDVAMDVNGDGKEDIVRVYKSATSKAMTDILYSNGVSLYRPANPVVQDIGDWSINGVVVKSLPMRVNNDERTDLVRMYKSSTGKAMVDILYSSGNGFYRPDNATVSDMGEWTTYGQPVTNLSIDVNGDRQEDLLRLIHTADSKTITDILFSHGSGFYRPDAPVSTDIGDWSTHGVEVNNTVMDINKDGKGDVVRIFQTAEGRRAADILYSSGNTFYRPGPMTPIDIGPGDDSHLYLNATKPLHTRVSLFQLRKIDNQANVRIITEQHIYYGTSLLRGMRLEQRHYLRSQNGNYTLLMQPDGNVVLANAAGQTEWASNTAGSGATYMQLQNNGNLGVYRPDGSMAWSTRTTGYPAVSLAIADTGNLILGGSYGLPIWETKNLPRPLAEPTVSVMTYNIADNPTAESLEAVANTIALNNPDMVMLNEVRERTADPSTTDFFGNRLGYPYRHYAATTNTGLTGTKGLVLLSRYPLSNVRYHQSPMQPECYYNGNPICPKFGMLQATANIRGVAHEVFSLRFAPPHDPSESGYHWSELETNRLGHAQAMAIINSLPADRPIIMAGDFNARWNQLPWAITFRDTSGLRDALVEFERQYPQLDRDWGNRPDYIYFRGPYVLQHARMQDGYDGASDHMYVYAAFYAPGSSPTNGGSSMNY